MEALDQEKDQEKETQNDGIMYHVKSGYIEYQHGEWSSKTR